VVCENIEVVNADAVEFLQDLDEDSIDIVFTSPPFREEDVDGDYWKFYDAVQEEILRVAAKAVFVVQSATHLNELITRYRPERTLIWGKKVSQYPYRYNPILCFQVDEEYSLASRIWTDAIGVPSVPPSQKVHKYQDPVTVYRTILGMFSDCETVLDPFMGSGTTLVAARQLGLSAVGVDNDPECIDIAKIRLQQQTLRDDF